MVRMRDKVKAWDCSCYLDVVCHAICVHAVRSQLSVSCRAAQGCQSLSCHRPRGTIEALQIGQWLIQGSLSNSIGGGGLQASPEGGLLQSRTVSDVVPFTFAGGEEREVPASYIEFAQRKALPEFEHLPVRTPSPIT